MPPIDGNSESGKRRSSTAENLAQQSEDDYDLTANTVSDGFRPSAPTGPSETSPSFPSPSRSDPSQLSSSLPQPTPSAAATPPKDHDDFNRPSSISKAPLAHDSLILRNDGLTSPRNGQSSSSGSTTQVNAQYQGATEPSHPYQMYPQRTYSNATSSTEPLSSVETYDGPRGPTHPYAMYTQNTATPEDTTHRLIPVGFNGMGSGYRRQLGPDGEEAGDLIGPLGHTEELPPYTRYPHESFAAKSATEIEVAAPINPDVNATRNVGLIVSSSPGHPIPGAGGIGLATRNPEFSSTEDDLLSPPQRPGSLRSVPSVESHHHVNEAAQEYAEKPTQGKWQRRARKKLWGIVPYWAICLLLSGIVIMGVVMGTVIGTIVTRQREPPLVKDQPTGQKPLSSNVQYLLKQPHGLPPLNTGCYALPPMEKYQVPKACIKDSSQSPAWSCDMPFPWYSMNVTSLQDAPDTSNYALKLARFDPKAPKYIWGSQPPDIPEFKPLSLVKDPEERNRGAAWYLEVEYNKTVILRGDQLHATSSSSPSPIPTPTGAAKRHWGPPTSPFPGYDGPRIMSKGSAATDRDNPWICTWPNIKLQVFIYPNQTFTPTKTTTSAGPVSTESSDPLAPSNYKEPYPKLVKFVERRLENSPAAICTQYKIINGGRDKLPNIDDDGNPITIKINEFSKGTRGIITDGLASSSSLDVSSLQERDVDLTPCGCVSFFWSV